MMDVKINKREYVMLPVLPAESLLVSIRNPGKFLLPLLFLLLFFLGQSPLKVLDHSILLFFWPVTLTLLVVEEERRTDEEEARDTLCLFYLKWQNTNVFTTLTCEDEEGGFLYRTCGSKKGCKSNITEELLVLLFHFFKCQPADLG